MQVPDTAYALDHMRPDMVLLMVLGRSLILWDTIEPTEVSAGPWCAATQCSYSPCNMPEHVCCGRILSFYCVGRCSEALRPSGLPCQQCQECAQAGRSFHHNCWSATARPGSRSCKQRRCLPALLLLWLPFFLLFFLQDWLHSQLSTLLDHPLQTILDNQASPPAPQGSGSSGGGSAEQGSRAAGGQQQAAVDWGAVGLAHVNAISGGCFALGLRFAGRQGWIKAGGCKGIRLV